RRRAAPVLRRHGVSKAFLFGSVVRGDVHLHSDIDIAVEAPQDAAFDLLTFVGLGLELESALGSQVDLVDLATMKPRIRERAETEKVPLL
ncbi:MAG: nucleotidyltransferase family protein, partial [Chloroflexota bacterium]